MTGTNWQDPWLRQGGHTPPPNRNVYFDKGRDGRPVFINNIGVNQRVNLILTNPLTGEVRHYQDIGYGQPWSFPGDLPYGSNWEWSAGYGDTYCGGGVFQVADNGYFEQDYIRPQYPIEVYYNGYTPLTVDAGDWYIPYEGCPYVVAGGVDYYPDQMPPEEAPADTSQPVVIQPQAWSEGPVTQAPQTGVPPLFYGTGLPALLQPAPWWRQHLLLELVTLGVAVTVAAVVVVRGYRQQHAAR